MKKPNVKEEIQTILIEKLEIIIQDLKEENKTALTNISDLHDLRNYITEEENLNNSITCSIQTTLENISNNINIYYDFCNYLLDTYETEITLTECEKLEVFLYCEYIQEILCYININNFNNAIEEETEETQQISIETLKSILTALKNLNVNVINLE